MLISRTIIAYKISIKKACKIFALSRSVYYREPQKKDEGIKVALLGLAEKHIRWGFKKMYQTLRREHIWNHKRIKRVYCELKLNIRKKPKKRLPARDKQALRQPLTGNYCWSIDFMSDALTSGRKFRTLNVLDDFNRECLGIKISNCLPARCVIEYLDFISQFRGYPKKIRVDNGPEFIAKEFELWAEKRGIAILHIQPGKPAQNAYIERFNRTYREDVLDLYMFDSIEEVQKITDDWLDDYNKNRPHQSLNNLAPLEFSRVTGGIPPVTPKGAVGNQQQFLTNQSTLELS